MYGAKRSGVEEREKVLWRLGTRLHHWSDRKAADHSSLVRNAPMRECWMVEEYLPRAFLLPIGI